MKTLTKAQRDLLNELPASTEDRWKPVVTYYAPGRKLVALGLAEDRRRAAPFTINTMRRTAAGDAEVAK